MLPNISTAQVVGRRKHEVRADQLLRCNSIVSAASGLDISIEMAWPRPLQVRRPKNRMDYVKFDYCPIAMLCSFLWWSGATVLRVCMRDTASSETSCLNSNSLEISQNAVMSGLDVLGRVGCDTALPETRRLSLHRVTRRKLQTPGNAEEHKRQESLHRVSLLCSCQASHTRGRRTPACIAVYRKLVSCSHAAAGMFA